MPLSTVLPRRFQSSNTAYGDILKPQSTSSPFLLTRTRHVPIISTHNAFQIPLPPARNRQHDHETGPRAQRRVAESLTPSTDTPPNVSHQETLPAKLRTRSRHGYNATLINLTLN